VRRRVERWLRTHGVTEDALIDVQLALGEAVSNSMEHAYRDAEPGGVDIDLEVRSGGAGRELVARVTDRGRWKPATSRPSHRGRGLTMIDGLSADMLVTSNHAGTEVGFTVPLDIG
jgi:anti-sigma regulatory factor (Ser/Thr protein kinase)